MLLASPKPVSSIRLLTLADLALDSIKDEKQRSVNQMSMEHKKPSDFAFANPTSEQRLGDEELGKFKALQRWYIVWEQGVANEKEKNSKDGKFLTLTVPELRQLLQTPNWSRPANADFHLIVNAISAAATIGCKNLYPLRLGCPDDQNWLEAIPFLPCPDQVDAAPGRLATKADGWNEVDTWGVQYDPVEPQLSPRTLRLFIFARLCCILKCDRCEDDEARQMILEMEDDIELAPTQFALGLKIDGDGCAADPGGLYFIHIPMMDGAAGDGKYANPEHILRRNGRQYTLARVRSRGLELLKTNLDDMLENGKDKIEWDSVSEKPLECMAF